MWSRRLLPLVIVASAGLHATAGGALAQLYAVNAADELLVITSSPFAETPVGPIGFPKVQGLAYDAPAGRLYGITASGQLLLLDRATGKGTILQTLPGSGFRFFSTLALEPGGGHLYTTNVATAQVYRVDLVNSPPYPVITLGISRLSGQPRQVTGLAFEPSTGTLYAVNRSDYSLAVMDKRTGALVSSLPKCGINNPEDIAFETATSILFGLFDPNVLATYSVKTGIASKVAATTAYSALTDAPQGSGKQQGTTTECGACTFSSECVSGLVCDNSVCIAFDSKSLGQPCCNPNQCNVTQKTSQNCSISGFCQCQFDFQCPAATPICQAKAGGNVCIKQPLPVCSECSSADECLSGNCSPWPNRRCITAGVLNLGESCCKDRQCKSGSCNSDGICQCKLSSDCGPDYYCDLGTVTLGKNTCKPQKGECQGCTADKQCASPTTCKSGKCVTLASLDLGATCCKDGQCKSGSCNSDKKCQCKVSGDCPSGQFCKLGFLGLGKNSCVTLKGECEGCIANKQCASGNCKGGKCASHAFLDKGESCCKDYQCKSGRCKNGKCR